MSSSLSVEVAVDAAHAVGGLDLTSTSARGVPAIGADWYHAQAHLFFWHTLWQHSLFPPPLWQ